MAERLADVKAHIDSVRQLSMVVSAMRSLAASRARDARERLGGIKAYAATVSNAIGDTLGLAPTEQAVGLKDDDGTAHLVIAICAEQGFAGAFNERVLDHVGLVAKRRQKPSAILVVGSRGATVAQERNVAVEFLAPMMAHADQAARLASRIADAVYDRVSRRLVNEVSLVHGRPGLGAALNVADMRLVPFDFGRFPAASRYVPPLITLPRDDLLAHLSEEYVFAEILEALILSFAAENEARMRAMTAAQEHVGDRLESLIALSRRLRQEEITSEIVELSASAGQTAKGR